MSVLPTEPGHYLDKDQGYWRLTPSGTLYDPSDEDDSNGDPAQYAPFTRLYEAPRELPPAGHHRFKPFMDADGAIVCGHVTGPGGTGAPPEICGHQTPNEGYAEDHARLQHELAKPPAGWFTFGSHPDSQVELEFWGNENGVPIWERPVAPSVNLVKAREAAEELHRRLSHEDHPYSDERIPKQAEWKSLDDLYGDNIGRDLFTLVRNLRDALNG